MIVNLTCPRCPRRIKLDDRHWTGAEHTCPECDGPFTVYRGADGKWATSLVNRKAVAK